jgi:hypothetical protein
MMPMQKLETKAANVRIQSLTYLSVKSVELTLLSCKLVANKIQAKQAVGPAK